MAGLIDSSMNTIQVPKASPMGVKPDGTIGHLADAPQTGGLDPSPNTAPWTGGWLVDAQGNKTQSAEMPAWTGGTLGGSSWGPAFGNRVIQNGQIVNATGPGGVTYWGPGQYERVNAEKAANEAEKQRLIQNGGMTAGGYWPAGWTGEKPYVAPSGTPYVPYPGTSGGNGGGTAGPVKPTTGNPPTGGTTPAPPGTGGTDPRPGAPNPAPYLPPVTGGVDPRPGTPTPTPAPSPVGTQPGTGGTTGGQTPAGPVLPGQTAPGNILNNTSPSGYSSADAAALRAQSNGYTNQNWEVTPEQMVEDRLHRILGTDSPLRQQAETQAKQAFNAKGLINSSMAATAGLDSVTRAALPIAQQDAQTQAASAQFNAGATNSARAFTAGAGNTAELQNAQIGTQTNLTNAQEKNKGLSFSAGATNAERLARLDDASKRDIATLGANTQLNLKQMDTATQQALATAEIASKNLLQTNATAASMQNQLSQNILSIQSNNNIDGPNKIKAINFQIETYKKGLMAMGSIAKLNLTQYFEGWEAGTEDVGSGTGTGSGNGNAPTSSPAPANGPPGWVWDGTQWVNPQNIG